MAGRLIGAIRAQAAAGAVPAAVQSESDRLSQEIAEEEARRIISSAGSAGRQARMAARSVQVITTDGDPTIQAGGSLNLRGKVVGGDVFFGSEFGGRGRPTTQQFPPFRASGYWFTATLTADEDEIFEEWDDALTAGAAVWRGV